jgi:hypothetical protein
MDVTLADDFFLKDCRMPVPYIESTMNGPRLAPDFRRQGCVRKE